MKACRRCASGTGMHRGRACPGMWMMDSSLWGRADGPAGLVETRSDSDRLPRNGKGCPGPTASGVRTGNIVLRNRSSSRYCCFRVSSFGCSSTTPSRASRSRRSSRKQRRCASPRSWTRRATGPPSPAIRLSAGTRPMKNSSRFALIAAREWSRASGGAAESRASSRREEFSSSHHSSRFTYGSALILSRRTQVVSPNENRRDANTTREQNARGVIHLSTLIHRLEIRRTDAPSRTTRATHDVLIARSAPRPLLSQHCSGNPSHPSRNTAWLASRRALDSRGWLSYGDRSTGQEIFRSAKSSGGNDGRFREQDRRHRSHAGERNRPRLAEAYCQGSGARGGARSHLASARENRVESGASGQAPGDQLSSPALQDQEFRSEAHATACPQARPLRPAGLGLAAPLPSVARLHVAGQIRRGHPVGL